MPVHPISWYHCIRVEAAVTGFKKSNAAQPPCPQIPIEIDTSAFKGLFVCQTGAMAAWFWPICPEPQGPERLETPM
jgi:hypothetical protein